MRWPLLAAWTSAALAAAAVAAALVLHGIDPDPQDSALAIVAEAALAAPALVAGVAIARGRPRNPVGAIVAVIGLLPAADAFLGAWASAAAAGEVAGAGWAVLLFQEDWIVVFGALALLLLLFPDGRPISRRWRAAVGLAIGGTLATAGATLVRDDVFDAPYASVPPPLGLVSGTAADVLTGVALLSLIAALGLAAVSTILRFRRSRGVERTQMKWLAAGAALLPVAIVAGTVDGLVNDEPTLITFIPFVAAYVALVAAVVVAMLRHGLYDVDRVISRTIAWGALTLALAAGAVGLALLVADPLGGGSTAGAAVAAVAVALAFDPLRRRLQRVVDRRFDRDRARAVERVEAFAALIHTGEAAPEGIEGLLREALGDPGLRLLVWLPGTGAYAGLDGGVAAAPSAGPGTAVTAVGRGDAPLPWWSTIRGSTSARACWPTSCAPPPSRWRSRACAASSAAGSRRSRRAAPASCARATRSAAGWSATSTTAPSSGWSPSAWRSAGCSGASPATPRPRAPSTAPSTRWPRPSATCARSPAACGRGCWMTASGRRWPTWPAARRWPWTSNAPADRAPPEIETAAYYVVSEALANAVKHAEATRVSVTARRHDGRLVVRVEDDGRGGAVPEPAGGLAGLADRIAAHGGHMELESRPGEGTRLEVELPCGS